MTSKTNHTPVTRTLKGNEKQFELARVRVIGWIEKIIICHVAVTFLIKGKEIQFELGKLELSEFELTV